MMPLNLTHSLFFLVAENLFKVLHYSKIVETIVEKNILLEKVGKDKMIIEYQA